MFYNINESIIHPNGGIIIIPLNFFCSLRKQDVKS